MFLNCINECVILRESASINLDDMSTVKKIYNEEVKKNKNGEMARCYNLKKK